MIIIGILVGLFFLGILLVDLEAAGETDDWNKPDE